MNVIMHKYYTPVERTLSQAVSEKLKVLREFCVVDYKNERQIKNQLLAAVKAEPNKDFDIVLDRVARSMIDKKLSD